jgi:hypothetical protein
LAKSVYGSCWSLQAADTDGQLSIKILEVYEFVVMHLAHPIILTVKAFFIDRLKLNFLDIDGSFFVFY